MTSILVGSYSKPNKFIDHGFESDGLIQSPGYPHLTTLIKDTGFVCATSSSVDKN